MVNTRIYPVRTERTETEIHKIFGEYDLVDHRKNRKLAPVKKVALITESFLPKVDGVSKTAYLTLKYLQETGREVLVFAPDSSVRSVEGSQVIPLPSMSLYMYPEMRIALPNTIIAKHVEAFQPDLIHLFSPAVMSVNGMTIARQLNLPVIANYQTDLPGYMEKYGYDLLSHPVKRWLRYIHNGCHLTLVPTKSTQQQLHSWGYRRLREWGRGVNIKRFDPSKRSMKMRQKLLNGRDENSLLCLYVGRLANEKRVDLLLQVAKMPNVSLTIVGDGPDRQNLESLFEGTNTHFTGYLTGDGLAEAFASSDVFVFTGPNETFGQVVQEAMASGLPTVITSLGASSDQIVHGVTGFMVEPTHQSFANAVLALQNNPSLRSQMGQAGLELAQQRPWSAIMNQLEDYYAEAVDMNQRFIHLFGKTRYHKPASVPHWMYRNRRRGEPDLFSEVGIRYG